MDRQLSDSQCLPMSERRQSVKMQRSDITPMDFQQSKYMRFPCLGTAIGNRLLYSLPHGDFDLMILQGLSLLCSFLLEYLGSFVSPMSIFLRYFL